jgi:hypothetical protein
MVVSMHVCVWCTGSVLVGCVMVVNRLLCCMNLVKMCCGVV